MSQKLPTVREEDRHIAGIDLSKKSIPDDDILDAEKLDEGEEQEDGSVLFHIEGDTDDSDSGEFLENLAEMIDETTLNNIASELVDMIEKDKQARSKRDQKYQEGLRRTGLGDDAPGGAGFEGASKVVHPILAESCIDFEARAIKELFPPNGPVKTNIIGKKTEEKLARADRKARYLNWQMTKQMSEYRPVMEQILTQVPMGGSQYQSFYFDQGIKRTRTEFVPIDDVLLPYACTDFYSAHRVTRVLHLTQNELERRVANEMYRDVVGEGAPTNVDTTAAAGANDKIEGKEADGYNEDGLRDVYEIYVDLTIDVDGRTEGKVAPYILTIDEHTDKVLALYRNWDEQDASMKKLHWMVEWQFIPWRGAYAIGLPHIIGGLSGAATGALRALLDSAHINNNAAMIKLKSGKSSGQNISVNPTEIAEIDAPAGTDDIRKVMMPMPYNPPSTVLFSLLGWLTDAGKGVIATTEEAMSGIGDRTPVGTTLAMVEQGSHTYSAIHARLHYSQARALEIMCRINANFLDDEVVVEELDELIVSRVDFQNSQDILPVTDPNTFSETQRFAQMQGVGQVNAMFPDLAWNRHAIARRMLNRMRVDDIDEILPPEKKPENMNPVGENVAAMQGTPLLAMPNQNHMAHILAHLEFCGSPVFGSKILGAKLIPTMLEHIKQHLAFYYSNTMGELTNFRDDAAKIPTKEMEQRIAEVQDQAMDQMNQQLAALMPALEKLAQQAAEYAPQPPIDPSVQATKEVAMADLDRKKQRDAAELEIAKGESAARIQADQMRENVKIQMNTQDNQQHQQTELAKNREDNMTEQWIAQLKAQNENGMNAMQTKLDAFIRQMEGNVNQQMEHLRLAMDHGKHRDQLELQREQGAADRTQAAEQHKEDVKQAAAAAPAKEQ